MRWLKIALILFSVWGRAQESEIPVAVQECNVVRTPVRGPGSVVTHSDGHLMYFNSWQVCHSRDGGQTWENPVEFDVPGEKDGMYSVIRLASGKLGLLGDIEIELDPGNFIVNKLFWWTSADEGLTWEGPARLNPSGQSGLPYSGHTTAIQTSKGRLIIPVRYTIQACDTHDDELSASGQVAGRTIDITGHGHGPEMDITFCYLSDDEGKTWYRSVREIFIWKDDGFGGMWPMDEPWVVELKSGGILLFGRTTLGRLYQARSKDGGVHWGWPQPTELASSYSPFILARIPRNGDLLCVWNQVSAEEIRSGHWRSRLSCAISRDDGASWEKFKIIDVQGVKPVGKIIPGKPQLLRPEKNCGELADDYGVLQYPSAGFYKDSVLITYNKQIYKPPKAARDMVIIPVDWFYK